MPLPDTTNWTYLHIRFMRGDFSAGEKIIEHFLPRLTQRFVCYRPDLDDHLIAESVEDALLNYLVDPERFDASRGVPLDYWLYIQTRGRLSHLLQREQTHRRHEQAIGIVDEDFAEVAKIMSRKGSENGYLLIGEEVETACSEERQLLAQFSPEERDALLLLEQRAPKEEWVQLLGLEGLPPAEQEQQINRDKERIRKKRQRILRHRKYRRGRLYTARVAC